MYRLIFFVLFAVGLFFIALGLFDNKGDFKLRKWEKTKISDAEDKRLNIIGRKQSTYQRFRNASIAALKASNSKMTYHSYLRFACICGIIGFLIGLFFSNIILSIFLALAFLFLPLLFLTIKKSGYTVYLNDQIQTALSMITNSYLQSDDIVRAVKENLHRIDEPLYTVFSEFVASNTFIDANTVRNIRDMQAKVDNHFFSEWCNTLVLCQSDRELKYVLPTIVEKMADVHELQEEMNTMMYSIYKSYVMVCVLVIANIPFMKILNADWYDLLIHTTIGKGIVLIIFAAVFFGTAWVIHVNKPVSNL